MFGPSFAPTIGGRTPIAPALVPSAPFASSTSAGSSHWFVPPVSEGRFALAPDTDNDMAGANSDVDRHTNASSIFFTAADRASSVAPPLAMTDAPVAASCAYPPAHPLALAASAEAGGGDLSRAFAYSSTSASAVPFLSPGAALPAPAHSEQTNLFGALSHRTGMQFRKINLVAYCFSLV